jgi:hypothetical protein
VGITGGYIWALIHNQLYDLVRPLMLITVTSELLGACIFVFLSLVQSWRTQLIVRRSMVVLVLGTFGALLPFCLLTTAPPIGGGDYILSPDLAMFCLLQLPASLSVSILGRQYSNIALTLQRHAVAFIVWSIVITSLGIAMQINVFTVAVIVLFFYVFQDILRQCISRYLLMDHMYALQPAWETGGSEFYQLKNDLIHLVEKEKAARRTASAQDVSASASPEQILQHMPDSED